MKNVAENLSPQSKTVGELSSVQGTHITALMGSLKSPACRMIGVQYMWNAVHDQVGLQNAYGTGQDT